MRMESQNQITTPPPVSNGENKATFQRSYSMQFRWKFKLPLALVSLIILASLFSIYYFLKKTETRTPGTKCDPGTKCIFEPQESIPPIQVPMNEIAQWKTYTNFDNGFQIRYPNNATLKEIEEPPSRIGKIEIAYINPQQKNDYSQNTSIYGLHNAYFIQVWFDRKLENESLESNVNTAYNQSKKFCSLDITPTWYPVQVTELAEKKAFSYAFENCAGYSGTTYWVSQGNKIFTIQTSYKGTAEQKDEYAQTINNTLSTFKFLDKQGPFVSQQECEDDTGKICAPSMCDYIPPGKTVEEVCGNKPGKGWYPKE